MLPKEHRLKRKNAYNATYKQKKTVSDGNICIYFGKDKKETDSLTLYGFVVSKKIHKRAVVRNRIKRLMREVVRQIIKNDENNITNKYISLIFVAKQGAVNANYEDISSSIHNLIKIVKTQSL